MECDPSTSVGHAQHHARHHQCLVGVVMYYVRRIRKWGGRLDMWLLSSFSLPARIRSRCCCESALPLSSNASMIITIGPIISSESFLAGFMISSFHCCKMSAVFLSDVSR